MIKEARRTVEVRVEHMCVHFTALCHELTVLTSFIQAARPRPVPVAEKENNPLRTPDTLLEGAAMEYRLLRAELTR